MTLNYYLNGNRHIREYFSLDMYTQEEVLYGPEHLV